MQPGFVELIAAIIGGVLTIIAALIPLVFRKKNGKVIRQPIPEGLAAVIGVVQKEGYVLMVQRRRRYRNLSWQFPAGVVKPGEDMQDQVEMEVFNETGVHCKVKRYLGARVHEETKVLCHYFHCMYLDGEACNKDERENAQVMWVKASDVRKYVTSSLYHEVEVLLDEIGEAHFSSARKRVVLGIVTKENKILLVKKNTGDKTFAWQLPGGTVESSESDKVAIQREVNEETGITCIAIRKLGERIHPESDQLIAYWLCDYETGEPILREPDKFLDVQWIDKADAIHLLGSSLYQPVKRMLLGGNEGQ